MPEPIQINDRVLALDAHGKWLDAVAISEVEPVRMLVEGRMRKVHDFPVIWVSIAGRDPVPWPAEDVRPAGAEYQGTRSTSDGWSA